MRLTLCALLAASIPGVAAGLGAEAPGLPSRPETYGGTSVSYVRVSGLDFQPVSSTTSYNSSSGSGRYSFNNGNFGVFAAPLHLPGGAKVVYLELDYADGTPSGAEYGTLSVYDSFGNSSNYPAAGAGPNDCLIPGYVCSGTAQANGYFFIGVDLTPEDITVDNLNYSYVVHAGNTTLDSSTAVMGMLVGYVLQVSPAPAMPTFNDVPTGHPFYQFIEALVSSGVTAGCGAGNYCPDAPLTRGQMAVFLSKALGLQFH
jgi:hypothetical protein